MPLTQAVAQFLALILAPAVLWIGYAYYHDRFRPQPLVLTAFAYLLGFLAAMGCLQLYGLLPLLGLPAGPGPLLARPGPFLAYSIGVTGLLEEGGKLAAFLLMTRFRDFVEENDGLFYAAIVALGFASYENIRYVGAMQGFELIGRALSSPLTHTVFSSIWGYALGVALIRRRPFWPALGRGLGLAALCHGVFNFMNLSDPLRLASALVIMALWLWRIRVSERLSRGVPPSPGR